MELALTLFAFDVANKLATLLVGTGLIFIPLAWLFWKNWSQPARSQEARAAAPVSLRRMEQDIGLALLAMLLAFLPIITISSANITYNPPLSETSVSADSFGVSTTQPSPSTIKLPVLWWVVIQFSSAFTDVFTTAIHSFETPQQIRALAMALDYVQISNAALKDELAHFDLYCYRPALAAVEEDPNVPPPPIGRYWRGDNIWFQNPNYYQNLMARPPYIPPIWAGQYTHPDNPGPSCATWWSESGNGLRDKLYDEIRSEVRSDPHAGTDDFLGWIESAKNLFPNSPPDLIKNDIVRAHFARKPSAGQSLDNPDSSGSGIFSMLSTIGSAMVYPVIKTTMAALIVVLPILQAMMLACIYIALPLAVPFVVLRPGLIVFFAAAIFSVKFLSGIWALAKFIDERLIAMMYGGRGIFAGSSGGSDILLMIVAVLAYVGLPAVWLWLLSSFTSPAISGVNSLFTHSATHMAMVGQAGMSVAGKAASGTSSLVKGVSKGGN